MNTPSRFDRGGEFRSSAVLKSDVDCFHGRYCLDGRSSGFKTSDASRAPAALLPSAHGTIAYPHNRSSRREETLTCLWPYFIPCSFGLGHYSLEGGSGLSFSAS